MKPFSTTNGTQSIPTDKIDSYISYMSQVYNVQQYMLIHAQNQIMQAQLLKLQNVSQNQNGTLQQKTIKLLEQIQQSASQISIKDFLQSIKMPILVKYIANIMIYLMKQCVSDSEELIMSYIRDPNSIVIDKKQWTLICDIVNKKLVYLGTKDILCTNDSQIGIISQSLLFSNIISEVIFKKLHITQDNTQQIVLRTLNDLLSDDNRSAEFLYQFMCQTESQVLTVDQCIQSFQKMFQKMGQYFHQSNLIEQIIENQKQFNTNGNFECYAEKYLKIIKIYQNNDQKLISEQLIKGLFGESKQIDCKEFIFNSNRLENKLKSILFVFVELVRIENQIIQIVIENKISEEPQKNPLEYYAKLIEKIKNKCKSKEDEYCNCKRCQCVKRNRDSARESQKRKREALEKIGPLQKECEKIEKKVQFLEFQNTKLKSVLFEALKNPVIESIIKNDYSNTLSNFNIISNQSQDSQQSQSYQINQMEQDQSL
ncbi:unnamed protein product [Paramecium sonneborni]|uniref:BZIP domain-containing protein n=1 Tax=Paramecium sonneborni TaxID=65129 RepID=A0A8S1LRJ3_9CILI|nr:unnamed protein product [Paramecium sonneborni]